MARRPRNEHEARRAGWTDSQIRNDWPLRKRRENLPDGAGPEMPDWSTEDERNENR